MNLLIPLAAFAVSVASANALSPDLLRQAGLNEEQIAAFHEARELKEAGDFDKARDVLIEANIDEEVMEELRQALKEHRQEHNIAIKAAVEANDYESFKAAVAGSPLGEIIDSEAEFERFVAAHGLMRSGERDEAKEIFDDLGLNWGQGKLKHRFGHPHFMNQLSDEEREELREAMEAGDKNRVKEILKEAGIDWKQKVRHSKDR